MTPTLLQNCLVEEIKILFDGFLLKNSEEELVPINVYLQYLPTKKREEDADFFPYIVVRVEDGEEEIAEDSAQCRVVIITGICDWDENYQGYRDVMNILEKMRQHFLKKRIIDNRFEIQGKLKWAINQEEAYPYFFGGLDTTWSIGKLNMEDKEV